MSDLESMVQKVDLDENKHALSILHRLDQMKRDLRHCDFTVSVGENEYRAHRYILSAGSDYFDAMLTHDTKESQLGKVKMMDVDSECVKVCIDYIYTGKADIPDGKVEGLMFVAHLMQLDELCDGIVGTLRENLSVENLFKTKVIAEKFNLKVLLAKCFEFARQNIMQFFAHSTLSGEQKQFLFDMFKCRNFSMTEEEKLVITLNWIKNEPANVEHLTEFVGLMKLQDISVNCRRHLIESEPLVMNNANLVKVISISIMDSMEVQGRSENSLIVGDMAVILDKNSDYLEYYNLQEQKTETVHYHNYKMFLPCSVTTLHSHIYVLSKDRSVHRLRIADENAKWEKMQNMIEYHGSSPRVVPHSGSLYVIGGSFDCCTAASEQYLPDENNWVKLIDKPMPTDRAAVVGLDEYIYCAGGLTGNKLLKTFFRFSPSSSTWTDLPPMAREKYSCGAAALNNKVFIFGGSDSNVYLVDADCFDVLTSQWMSLSPMSIPRGKSYALQCKGVIHVFGGERKTQSQWTEQYDVRERTWTKKRIGRNIKIHGAVKI